jgi:hypothetical protein
VKSPTLCLICPVFEAHLIEMLRLKEIMHDAANFECSRRPPIEVSEKQTSKSLHAIGKIGNLAVL